MASDVINTRTYRLGKTTIVEWAGISSIANNYIVYLFIKKIGCNAWLAYINFILVYKFVMHI